MRSSFSLVHPRRALRRLLNEYATGRRSRLLEEIPFASGLGDSVWVLYGLARSLKPEVCVEIGSARGKSACYVGLALEENGKGKLYAIDPHTKTEWNDDNSVETYEVMRQNLGSLGLLDRVEIVRKTSGQAALSWNMPIDLIFIDGDHTYEGVKRDWELFTPNLAPFGVVVFHDTAWEIDRVSRRQNSREDMGVPRFVEELRLAGQPVITLPRDFGVSIVQARPGGLSLLPPAVEVASSHDGLTWESEQEDILDFADTRRPPT